MEFSVILPTYNRTKFIKKAINSVLNLTFIDFELIIIDDGSTDHTREIVTNIKDSRIKYHYQEIAERSAARNKGIAKSSGAWICFLDSDVEYREIPLEIKPVFSTLGFDEGNESTQRVGSNVIHPYDNFCPMPFEQADAKDPVSFRTKYTYAIHLWNAAWFDPFRFFWNGRSKKGWQAVGKAIRGNPFQGWMFYRNVAYHIKCAIFGYQK